jgi:predicted amidohydrolase YtcJ
MEGINAETPTPFGGEIVKDPKTGEPTGWLKESAAGLWGWKHFPALTREQHKEGMGGVVKYLNTLGVTSAKEQHAKNHWAQAFKDLESDGDLTMRIGLSWTYKGPLEPSSIEEQEKAIEDRQQFASELIGTEYVKLSIDGTLGTTGLVVEPYLLTGDNGIQFYKSEDLADDVTKFDAMGLGITAHANADGAVRQFLDAIEEAKRRNGELKGRHQVAHAAIIHPDDLARFAELNVTAEFSPTMWFPTDLADGLSGQIGPERMEHVFPMKSLQDNDGRFVIATDGPLMWQVPLSGMESAISRMAPGGDEKTLAPNEGIDLPTAIKAYTINSAYLMNQDDVTGSIEEGKYADLIVLDQNLFEIPVKDIGETEVLFTVLNGKVVFDRAEAISALDVVDINITNKDLDNAIDAAELNLLVEDELWGGAGCRCFPSDITVYPGAKSASEEVNESFATLSDKGYRFARPARTVFWKADSSTYWIQWTVKDETRVLWAYDPELKEVVEVLQVRAKDHSGHNH